MADVPLSGSIDPAGFPFLLVDLHRKGATGSLKVDGPTYQKALYFRGGRVLFGSSNDPRDQLGAILIESGKITPEQLDDVSAKVGPGSPLAKVLTDTGFVNQRELSEAARAKVERILSDVIAYDSGSFEFEDGVLPKGAVDLKLSTERVVVAAVRRIADRNFVLRYVNGMEAVLRPTPDMMSRVAEIETDTSGVTHYLDGTRTLKEAASLARLDEFEAAKIGCALLFLGAVERVTTVDLGAVAAAAQAPSFDEPPPFMIDAETAPEIGLAPPGPPPTIKMDADAPVPAIVDAPSISMESADQPVVLMEPPPTVLMAPDPAAEIASPAPEPPALDIPAFEPPVSRAPAPVARPAPARRVYDMAPVPQIEIPPVPPAPRPPSKEDLAALDQLLRPGVERSKAAFEKPAADARAARTPSRPAPRTARRGGSSRAGLALGIAAAIALSASAAWYFLMRPPEPGSDARADVPVVTRPAPAVANPPVTAAAVTASTLPAASMPPATAPADEPADARTLMRRGRFPEAGRLFASEVKAAGRGASAVQLFVACSTETVQKAVDAVGASTLMIVPTRFGGRECYKLVWGVYPSADRAGAAMRTLPDYFRQEGVAPRVVPASEIVP